MSGTWGAPTLPPGRDDFKARQQPNPDPVDDLSRFVLDAIRRTESAPKHDVPQAYNKPAGPIAHRYAADMRADMIAFRRIVAAYCEIKGELGDDRASGLELALLIIANRFDTHPGFLDEWRLA